MNYFDDLPTLQQHASDFRSRLRSSIDRLIIAAQAGLKLEKANETVTRRYWMDDALFELGCKIASSNPNLAPQLWACWMINARLNPDGTISHRSKFYCEHANRELGPALKAHFGHPVRFVADRSLDDAVAV